MARRSQNDISEQVKTEARRLGAGDVGICSPSALPDNLSSINSMLPACRSVVCITYPHSSALFSSDMYLKQYDTGFTYGEVARISHYLTRFLEGLGFSAIAVPAFLPIDMADSKLGMVGAIDWRRTAVESGLTARGRSGLAISPRFGARMRIGGVITTAELKPDRRLEWSPCDGCQRCIESCPAGALSATGTDKKLCGDRIFTYGLRAFTRLFMNLVRARDDASAKAIVYSRQTRELWQALESGNYYSCWECQSVCPAGDRPA